MASSRADPLVVVVVSSSRDRARTLRGMLSTPGFIVAAEAWTPETAEAAIVAHSPAAVLLDVAAGAGGIEIIERIMGTRPTPVVACGALAEDAAAALAAGAVDVVGALDAQPSSPHYVTALRRHLVVASRVRVITHPRNRLRARGMGPENEQRGASAPAAVGVTAFPDESHVRLVVIGASTGGPPALATILSAMPADLPVPVLVVQHMADGFVEGLVAWLDGLCSLPVTVAEDGQRLRPGVVHVAPATMNAVVRTGLRIELAPPPAGQFHVPGVDVTFTSAARTCGARAVGVLLTGMGRDGAAGLRTLRNNGALTIGQDEATSVVWGMPGAARALGAVGSELALPAIAAAILAAVAEGETPGVARGERT